MSRTLIVTLVMVAACQSRSAPEPVTQPATPATTPAAQADPHAMPPGHGQMPPGHGQMPAGHAQMPAPGGGAETELLWTDPGPWRRTQPASTMRRAQFTIPGVGGSGEGELTVFYFGAGQGGALQDNLDRWYGQFEQPDGRATRDLARVEHRTVNGMNVTITRVSGRFAGGMAMGAAPSGAPASHDHWALLGAIAETTGGPWFFKLTGPEATVQAAAPVFDEFVASFHVR